MDRNDTKNFENIFNNSTINRSQTSFTLKVAKTDSDKPKIIPQNLENFVNSDSIFLQHREVLKMTKNNNDKLLINLPPFCGKTTSVFLAAIHKSYSESGISLIVYPDSKHAEMAFKLMNNFLESYPFICNGKGFNLITLIDDKHPVEYKDLIYPGIVLTDVFTLHKHILISITNRIFWQGINLVVIEDYHNYEDVKGLNCSFLFRRLFAKITTMKEKSYIEDKDFCVIGTSIQLNNCAEVFEELTSWRIPGEGKLPIITKNTQKMINHTFTHWFLPCNKVE